MYSITLRRGECHPGTIVCRPFCRVSSQATARLASARHARGASNVSCHRPPLFSTKSGLTVYARSPQRDTRATPRQQISLSRALACSSLPQAAHNHPPHPSRAGHTRSSGHHFGRGLPHARPQRCCHTHRNSIRVHSRTRTHEHTHTSNAHTTLAPIAATIATHPFEMPRREL